MTEARSKRRTDGEATRERILEAAGELFAAGGYAQTTAKAVADRAEVSLTLINYHFDGREGLYRAVLIEAHRRLGKLSDLRNLAESELPARAKLRVLIYGLVRPATRRQPGWQINVLAKEIFAPSAQFPVLFEAEVPPKLAIIKQILSDITAIPADDPALVRCVISVLAPCCLERPSSPICTHTRLPDWRQLAASTAVASRQGRIELAHQSEGADRLRLSTDGKSPAAWEPSCWLCSGAESRFRQVNTSAKVSYS
jgi:AcrR family transcriptional regulator